MRRTVIWIAICALIEAGAVLAQPKTEPKPDWGGDSPAPGKAARSQQSDAPLQKKSLPPSAGRTETFECPQSIPLKLSLDSGSQPLKPAFSFVDVKGANGNPALSARLRMGFANGSSVYCSYTLVGTPMTVNFQAAAPGKTCKINSSRVSPQRTTDGSLPVVDGSIEAGLFDCK